MVKGYLLPYNSYKELKIENEIQAYQDNNESAHLEDVAKRGQLSVIREVISFEPPTETSPPTREEHDAPTITPPK